MSPSLLYDMSARPDSVSNFPDGWRVEHLRSSMHDRPSSLIANEAISAARHVVRWAGATVLNTFEDPEGCGTFTGTG
jgi:hypothetical protein